MSTKIHLLKLIEKGFSLSTLKHLDENQIFALSKRFLSEQESEKVDQLNQKVSQLRQNISNLKNDMAELGEDEIDNIEPYKGQQTQDPKQVGPGSDDGMKDFQDGMVDEEVDNPYAICTSSLGLEGRKRDSYTKEESKKFERCVLDVKNESIRKIEESLVSLILQNDGMITKKDLIEQETAPVKPRVRPGTKPERGTPYKPKHSPKPKADTETTPTRVKPGTKEKPKRGTPYKPKHSPKPKAGDENSIPEFLTFNNLNISFRDE